MSAHTIPIAVELAVIHCTECGVAFGLATGHLMHLQKSGRDFYCPNGHEMGFGSQEPQARADIQRIHIMEQAEAKMEEATQLMAHAQALIDGIEKHRRRKPIAADAMRQGASEADGGRTADGRGRGDISPE